MLTTDTDLLAVVVVVVGVNAVVRPTKHATRCRRLGGRVQVPLYTRQCVGPALDRSMTDLGREMQPPARLEPPARVTLPWTQGKGGRPALWRPYCQVEGVANTCHRLWAASLGYAGRQRSKHLWAGMLRRRRVIGRV